MEAFGVGEPKRSENIMILRTDTIGHFENPTEDDIQKAISYANGDVCENDIVKLMINDESYLAVWIGKKENGHRLVFRHGKDIFVECDKKIDSNSAIQIMTKYLRRDMSWFKKYNWNQSIGKKFLEATEFLIRMASEQGD